MAGMACEVSLKAIIVNSPELPLVVTTPEKQLGNEDRDLRHKFYSHDLRTLFGLVKVELSEDEVLIMEPRAFSQMPLPVPACPIDCTRPSPGGGPLAQAFA